MEMSAKKQLRSQSFKTKLSLGLQHPSAHFRWWNQCTAFIINEEGPQVMAMQWWPWPPSLRETEVAQDGWRRSLAKWESHML